MTRLSICRAVLPAALSALGSLPVLPAQGFHLDYRPTTREVYLNTDFTFIQPTSGPPVPVYGGVFVFRNVTIPMGVTVFGSGSRPMIWVVTGDFIVQGEISVRGGDGRSVNTLNSANFPEPGGRGGCGGGTGGHGSPEPLMRSFVGENGFGHGGLPGGGGRGGQIWCTGGGGAGSGGGGGSFGTQGDPSYQAPPLIGMAFPQRSGGGGYGGFGPSGAATRTLPGGAAGPRPFIDARSDNDFFGLAYDVNRRLVVRGELPLPMGGQGGAGGGDMATNCNPNDLNFFLDSKGASGGGGGGAVVIVAFGRIAVEPTGRIRADGGNGGGGEQAGSCNEAGGGGGGSGGMLILWSNRRIELHTKGETYANGDYEFVVSADGGIGTLSAFGGAPALGKYGPTGGPVPSGAQWDRAPSGGFGGLGIIQLITPIGYTNADGTNTYLDDNVILIQNGAPLTGTTKQRYLAWRGFPDQNGIPRDDFGNQVTIGNREGDMRPTPILMPVF